MPWLVMGYATVSCTDSGNVSNTDNGKVSSTDDAKVSSKGYVKVSITDYAKVSSKGYVKVSSTDYVKVSNIDLSASKFHENAYSPSWTFKFKVSSVFTFYFAGDCYPTCQPVKTKNNFQVHMLFLPGNLLLGKNIKSNT